MDRNDLEAIFGSLTNKRSPFYGLTEAIRREAFFMSDVSRFSRRELYMTLDVCVRPGQNTDEAAKAVDDMLTRKGIPGYGQ